MFFSLSRRGGIQKTTLPQRLKLRENKFIYVFEKFNILWL